ncbi:hypothetical protein V1291_003583 [Nitrobacteraceae bacterium AZCC 1564]
MVIFSMSEDTKSRILAALDAHGNAPLATASRRRIKFRDFPWVTREVMAPWPADEDGIHRVVMTDVAAAITWRAFVLAEIAAGRGCRSDLNEYRTLLGIETRPAFDYVCLVARQRHVNCADAARTRWTKATQWLVDGGGDIPKGRSARDIRYLRESTHRKLAALGLLLLNQPLTRPVPTALFDEPAPRPPATVLAPADEAAIMNLSL